MTSKLIVKNTLEDKDVYIFKDNGGAGSDLQKILSCGGRFLLYNYPHASGDYQFKLHQHDSDGIGRVVPHVAIPGWLAAGHRVITIYEENGICDWKLDIVADTWWKAIVRKLGL